MSLSVLLVTGPIDKLKLKGFKFLMIFLNGLLIFFLFSFESFFTLTSWQFLLLKHNICLIDFSVVSFLNILLEKLWFLFELFDIFFELIVLISEDFVFEKTFVIKELLLLNLFFQELNFFMMLSLNFTNHSESDHIVVCNFDLGVLFYLKILSFDQFLDVHDLIFVLPWYFFNFIVFCSELPIKFFIFVLFALKHLFDIVDDLICCLKLLQSVLMTGLFAVESLFENWDLVDSTFVWFVHFWSYEESFLF